MHPPMPPTWPNRTGPRPTRLVWYGHAPCRLGGQSKHWQKNGLGTCAFWAPQTTHFPPTTGSKLNGFTRDLDHAPCNGVGMPTINFGANRTSWEQAAGPLPPQGTQKVPKSPLFHTYLSPNSMDSHGTLTHGLPMMHGSLLCRTSPGGGRTSGLVAEKTQKLHLSFLLGRGPQHSGQGKISDGQFLCHPRRSISPF